MEHARKASKTEFSSEIFLPQVVSFSCNATSCVELRLNYGKYSFLSDAILFAGKQSKNCVVVVVNVGQSLMLIIKLRVIDFQSMLRITKKRYPAECFFGLI